MTARVRPLEHGVRFHVRVTPRGGRNAVEGWQDDAAGKAHLKLRVTVAAADGKANDAVVRLVAESLAVPRTRVDIVSGASARIKMLEVRGDGAELQRRLAAFGEAS
jgi:uncharacterized protein